MSIKVYSKKDCIWCERAKNVLRNKKIPFTEYTFGEDFDAGWIRMAYPQILTLPIIVEDDYVIGGYTDLMEKISLNKDFGKKLIAE